MLERHDDYDTLFREFRWPEPEHFNIAHAVCDKWAAREPDRTALIHKRADGKVDEISYATLQAQANRLANLLKARGVGRGQRVGILLPQTPETAIAHIALYKLEAIAVPLASLFGVEALQYRLGNCGAGALITTHDQLAKIAEIREALPELAHVFSIDGTGDGVEDLHAGMAGENDRYETPESEPDTPALMIFTSGTTGPPKGALHAHRVLIGHLPGMQFSHDFLPRDGDILWTPADWAWAGGLLNVLLPGLYFGVPVVTRRIVKFDPEAAFALMADLKIRNIFIPPTALKLMRAVPDPGKTYALSLRTLFSGGEAVGRELQDWAQAQFGLAINEVYGQTECNLVLGGCSAIGVLKPGAIGKPVPGHRVAIIDRDGKPLPPGQPGNIAVQRPDPVMFLEYWGRPEATADKFIDDWMLTGDQGVVDEDGYFSFVGRDDDVITSAGYRIGPGEIEDCLLGHPAVAVAAVIGKPDPVRTEIVKAFIVLKSGYTASTDLADEIQAHVRTRLSAHEYPREISFEDSLPLTTTGKVIRRLLRERG